MDDNEIDVFLRDFLDCQLKLSIATLQKISESDPFAKGALQVLEDYIKNRMTLDVDLTDIFIRFVKLVKVIDR